MGCFGRSNKSKAKGAADAGQEIDARMLSSSGNPLTMPVNSEYAACDFPFKRHHGAGTRRVPSGMGLPDCWNEEMDRFICYCEAVSDLPLKTVIVSLKKRFPQLEKHTISELSIEKRVWCLDQSGDNDYFKKGADLAVERLEAAGHVLPDEPDWDAIENEAAVKRAREEEKVDQQVTKQWLECVTDYIRQANAAKQGIREPVTPPNANASTNANAAQPDAIQVVNDANRGDGGSDMSSNVAELTDYDRNRRYSSSLRKDPFTGFREPTTPDGKKRPVSVGFGRSDSTVRMPSRGTEHPRPEGSSDSNTMPGPSGIRRVGSTSSRVKDVAPVASLQRLRISEDDPYVDEANMYGAKPAESVVSNAASAAAQSVASSAAHGSAYSHGRIREGHSQSPHVTDYSNTSYGSPRTPHGRVCPWPHQRNPGSSRRNRDENTLGVPTLTTMGSNRQLNLPPYTSTSADVASGRRPNDENAPLGTSNTVNSGKGEEMELPVLPSRRYI
ncbi:MAG: hypothetical protein Q9218_007096 [Villophora microphyllina]